jgi:tetratricopeptide (TPR) repeat protein
MRKITSIGVMLISALDQKENAVKDYDTALSRDANLVDAYYNRGIAYADLEKYADAVRDFSETIRLNDKSAVAFYNRGLAQAKLGNSRTPSQITAKRCGSTPKIPRHRSTGGSAICGLINTITPRGISAQSSVCSRKMPTLTSIAVLIRVYQNQDKEADADFRKHSSSIRR